MKSRRQIINHRKQSRIDLPIKGLWYFSETTVADFAPFPRQEIERLENVISMNSNQKKFTIEKQQSPDTSSTNSFVVDWQISEAM